MHLTPAIDAIPAGSIQASYEQLRSLLLSESFFYWLDVPSDVDHSLSLSLSLENAHYPHADPEEVKRRFRKMHQLRLDQALLNIQVLGPDQNELEAWQAAIIDLDLAGRPLERPEQYEEYTREVQAVVETLRYWHLRLESLMSAEAGVQCVSFSGGGAKGAAYVGALYALKDEGILPRLHSVAGTSAGSLAATFVAVGMSPEHFDEVASAQDFEALLGESSSVLSFIARDGAPLLKTVEGEIFKAIQRFRRAAPLSEEQQVQFDALFTRQDKKITFADLKWLQSQFPETFKHLSINAIEVTPDENGEPLGRNLVFSSLSDDPDILAVPIADACRASMSIPVVFQEHEIMIAGRRRRFVDGGILDNLQTNVHRTRQGAVPSPKQVLLFGLSRDVESDEIAQAIFMGKEREGLHDFKLEEAYLRKTVGIRRRMDHAENDKIREVKKTFARSYVVLPTSQHVGMLGFSEATELNAVLRCSGYFATRQHLALYAPTAKPFEVVAEMGTFLLQHYGRLELLHRPGWRPFSKPKAHPEYLPLLRVIEGLRQANCTSMAEARQVVAKAASEYAVICTSLAVCKKKPSILNGLTKMLLGKPQSKKTCVPAPLSVVRAFGVEGMSKQKAVKTRFMEQAQAVILERLSDPGVDPNIMKFFADFMHDNASLVINWAQDKGKGETALQVGEIDIPYADWLARFRIDFKGLKDWPLSMFVEQLCLAFSKNNTLRLQVFCNAMLKKEARTAALGFAFLKAHACTSKKQDRLMTLLGAYDPMKPDGLKLIIREYLQECARVRNPLSLETHSLETASMAGLMQALRAEGVQPEVRALFHNSLLELYNELSPSALPSAVYSGSAVFLQPGGCMIGIPPLCFG